MDNILAASDKEMIREVLSRMLDGEKGLHTKTIGYVKLVRKSTLPTLLAELVDHDQQRGALRCIKVVHKNGHEVALYERRNLQSR